MLNLAALIQDTKAVSMAKGISLINLNGTVGDYTFVKSAKYGDHIRAKRGTHKKAKLNEAFKKQTQKVPGANLHAKIFKDAIDPYREKLKDGTMWSRLISMFMQQFDVHGKFDFGRMEPFEIHRKYTFENLFKSEPTITINKKESALQISLLYNKHPSFKESAEVDGYRFSVTVVFPDLKKKTAKAVSEDSDIIKRGEKIEPVNIQVPIPRGAKSFLVCVRIDGCRNGKVDGPMTTKGMRMVGAGIFLNRKGQL